MRKLLLAVALVGSAAIFACTTNDPVQRVGVPGPDNPNAYQPVMQPKPLPPQGPTGPMPGMGGGPVVPNPSIAYEDSFLAAYLNQRNPRLMVMVSHGADAAANQQIGIAPEDYQMVELSVVKYFDNSGKVRVQDAEAARAKLNREQILRIENGDPAANRLLAVELQQDVLIRITAAPTRQASSGTAIRLLATSVGTADARVLGTAFVDMPSMSKSSINVFTQYLTSELMHDMANKWSLPPEFPTTEVRVYKVASVDDGLRIGKWLQGARGVKRVITNGATGGNTTAYASFAVGYAGAPEELYGELKEAIGMSQGIKAVDLTHSTINLEVTGQMNLVTTTMRQETRTTTEVKTTEERKVEPISPATEPGK